MSKSQTPTDTTSGVDPSFVDAIDEWRATQPGNLSRADAIRYIEKHGINIRTHEPSKGEDPKGAN